MSGMKEDFKKESCIFTISLIWPHPSARTPAPEVIKSTILVDSYLVIITLDLVCLIYASEERRFLKGIMHFHDMTYMATLKDKNLCPEVIKFTILVDPSLVILTIYSCP